MRIRHRHRPEEQYEAIGETWAKDQWIAIDAESHVICCHKERYEPVPVETWVDVTRGCETSKGGHRLDIGQDTHVEFFYYHRFVKERLWRLQGGERMREMNNGGGIMVESHGNVQLEPVDALRVERKA